jgi:primosomal protein N' (replication factor Y)
MFNLQSGLVVAESKSTYQLEVLKERWLEVLVDCPNIKKSEAEEQGSREAEGRKLYTYRIPQNLSIQPGDIVSVPFSSQILGGIAIREVDSPPEDLPRDRIKDIEDVISSGFFPDRYWHLLERVAEYYCTNLIAAIKVALPPGILGRSQRRIRLKLNVIPHGAETFCSSIARQVLQLLKAQKDGDYSTQYLQRQIPGANRGIRELIKRDWVESYLEPPKNAAPKLQKAVTLVIDSFPLDVTQKQREVLEILRQRGGELWLSQILKIAQVSSSVVNSLQTKGCVVIEARERLRLLEESQPVRDRAKQLNSAQNQALEIIFNLQGYAKVLLHGVTGSGKTEVYLQAIAPILEKGKSAIVLVPEIGLTPQLTDRFRARFGDRVCVYHSALSDGERYDTWRQMLTGEPQIVIGTRSAIFAPLPQLGLIVLDEEHDSSFKQTQPVPTYHARTVATWRAELENCPLVLGSATPSLETWKEVSCRGGASCSDAGYGTQYGDPSFRRTQVPAACEGIVNSPSVPPEPAPCEWPFAPTEVSTFNSALLTGHYLSLPDRIQSRPLPSVEIVDMRQELQGGNRSIFSQSLQDAIAEMQNRDRQGILFVSRRGHSTFVSCRSCGYVLECPHCDVSLSYHYTHEGATELLRCHYCNYSSLQPSQCPECSSPYLKFFGSGTQRVTLELNKLFPQLRCIRYDSDTTSTKGSHRALIEQFARGEADLLVGTQMLTKGLDLDRVTLVGVIAADSLLHLSDYRAAERAFQTLTQVAGRAGRGEELGKVIIQTYSTEHPVIQAVKNHDYVGFVETELPQREGLDYPPYGRLILIKLSGLDEAEVQQTAESIADECLRIFDSECEILGPAPANIMRVKNRYRWQILLKFVSEEIENLANLQMLKNLCPRSVSMAIDVDPINMD